MATRNINKQVQFRKQYLYMLQDVTGYCLEPKNLPITKLVPDFETDMRIVDTKLQTILSNLGPRLIMTEGWATQKQYFRRLLAQSVFAVTSPVAGYYISTKKFDLAKQFSHSMSFYMKLKPNELASFAITVVDMVMPLLPSIIKTGITAASLDAINTARASFVPYINKPTNAKTDSKSNTQ